MSERLQKIISRAGIASRRHAEDLIVGGRVKVNGKVVTELGCKVDARRDRVEVDGNLLAKEKNVYILLYKPKGIVSTAQDPEGRRTVTDLVSDIPERLYPVGRLDYNTEGLLLLTNDGDLTHALTHPSNKVFKTYVAEVAGIPTEEKLDKLRLGIKLEDGVTAPARVKIMDVNREKNVAKIEIIIHEGRNRQIRRMFEAIGNPVNKLKRVQLAFLTLEGLRRGRYRRLANEEVESLKKLTDERKG
ncbi:MAG: rluB [Firmicutes bacterium]|nr:rluB [Bacillota bacterium]